MQAEKNKPTRVADAGGAPKHYNGSVGTSPVTTTFDLNGESVISTRLIISNTHATQDLLVTLDGSANQFTIAAGSDPLNIPVSVGSVDLEGSGAGTTYEMIVIS